MSILTFFVDIFFPPSCVGCNKEGVHGCPECLALIRGTLHQYGTTIYFLTFLHDFWVRKAIHLLKYSGIPAPVRLLCLEYISQIQGILGSYKNIVYIPVPISKKRLRERGYNQAEIIAQTFASVVHGKICTFVIKKTELGSVVGQGKEDRKKKAEEQFHWAGKVLPTADCYVLVDDVITTGSTIKRCMQLVQEQTGVQVLGLAVAHEK